MTSTARGVQTPPTDAELVARAVALQPLLRAYGSDGDLNRRLDDEVIAGLSAAGFYRLFKPAQFGGYSPSVRTVLEITEALGEADGSAAWLVGLGATTHLMLGRSEVRAQEEILGFDPDVRTAGSNQPIRARRVEGGVVISGRWPYSSGSHHAAWVGLGATVADDSGQRVDPYICLVPSSELRLEDTWHVAGMRATGSNTWVADELFVPQHRLISISTAGEPSSSAHGLDRLPFPVIGALMLVGPILGLGRAALSAIVADASEKAMTYTVFQRRSDSVGVQIQVAEAALMLQSSRMHAHKIADTLDTVVAGGQMLTYQDRAQIRAAVGYAVRQVIEAIQRLVDVYGSGAFAEVNPVQRFWRDANAAAGHAGLNAVVGYEVLGKALFGIDERISPLV